MTRVVKTPIAIKKHPINCYLTVQKRSWPRGYDRRREPNYWQFTAGNLSDKLKKKKTKEAKQCWHKRDTTIDCRQKLFEIDDGLRLRQRKKLNFDTGLSVDWSKATLSTMQIPSMCIQSETLIVRMWGLLNAPIETRVRNKSIRTFIGKQRCCLASRHARCTKFDYFFRQSYGSDVRTWIWLEHSVVSFFETLPSKRSRCPVTMRTTSFRFAFVRRLFSQRVIRSRSVDEWTKPNTFFDYSPHNDPNNTKIIVSKIALLLRPLFVYKLSTVSRRVRTTTKTDSYGDFNCVCAITSSTTYVVIV